MKKLLILICLAGLVTLAMGQSPLQMGQNQINAGVGLSEWGVPVYLGFDHGISRDVSIGAEVSYKNFREDYHEGHYNHKVMGLSGNANYHFNRIAHIPRDWDLYAGLNIGYYIWDSPDDYPGDHKTSVGLGMQLGGRYYFSDTFGVNLEFGGGNAFSGGKFGVTIKLK